MGRTGSTGDIIHSSHSTRQKVRTGSKGHDGLPLWLGDVGPSWKQNTQLALQEWGGFHTGPWAGEAGMEQWRAAGRGGCRRHD